MAEQIFKHIGIAASGAVFGSVMFRLAEFLYWKWQDRDR
jgi:hypothetical protein